MALIFEPLIGFRPEETRTLHSTLDVPGFPSPFNGGPICQELLTSGQMVIRRN